MSELPEVRPRSPVAACASVDAITHAEASTILGVYVTTVSKFLRDGRLEHTYPGYKRRLSGARVEELAAARWRPRHHTANSYWITGPEAAALLGCTKTSVYRMAQDGRLPEPHRSWGRLLFRRAQLEVIANAHRRRRGRRRGPSDEPADERRVDEESQVEPRQRGVAVG